jgi:hypothetical protein
VKYQVSLTLADGQKPFYQIEESNGTFWIYRPRTIGRDSIGSTKSLETALDLIRTHVGGTVVNTKVRDA